MHSGDIIRNFSRQTAADFRFFPFFSPICGEILDGYLSTWYIPSMKKTLVRIDPRDCSFRLVIPRRVILYKRWQDVEYVLVEDDGPDKLVIRRMIDGSALEADDQKPLPGFS